MTVTPDSGDPSLVAVMRPRTIASLCAETGAAKTARHIANETEAMKRVDPNRTPPKDTKSRAPADDNGPTVLDAKRQGTNTRNGVRTTWGEVEERVVRSCGRTEPRRRRLVMLRSTSVVESTRPMKEPRRPCSRMSPGLTGSHTSKALGRMTVPGPRNDGGHAPQATRGPRVDGASGTPAPDGRRGYGACRRRRRALR